MFQANALGPKRKKYSYPNWSHTNTLIGMGSGFLSRRIWTHMDFLHFTSTVDPLKVKAIAFLVTNLRFKLTPFLPHPYACCPDSLSCAPPEPFLRLP
jgi:hypothetical protein